MTPTASIVLQIWLFVHYSLAEDNMQGQKGINITGCLIQTAGFCLPDDYDDHVIPRQSHDPPLKVNVEFFVEQITEINDKRFTISIVMRLALYWRENRIVDIMPHRELRGHDVPLTYTWIEKLWYPDVFVHKMQDVLVTEILDPFGGNSLFQNFNPVK